MTSTPLPEQGTGTNQASEEVDRILAKYEIGFVTHGKDVSVHLANFKKELNALMRTEKLKLLDELDKSMPTAEQLTTKYGYHMPEKQYGYKLALHDIREVLDKLEAEL